MLFRSQPQLVPQQTGRADKTSIMALYGSNPQSPPPASPQPPQKPQFANQPQHQTQNPYQPQPVITSQQFSNAAPQQPGAASPLSSSIGFGGSQNPFMLSSAPSPFAQSSQNNSAPQGGLLAASGVGGIGSANGGNPSRHISHESMSVDPNGWHAQDRKSVV